MRNLSRRGFFGTIAAAGTLERLRAAVKPVKITGVNIFPIRIPTTDAEAKAGYMGRYTVCKVNTDAGVTGYSFAGASRQPIPDVKQILEGRDLFNVDGMLREGLWRWGGVEHAVWDAIGKIAGQPVYKLLGGAEDRVRAYLTCVWPGPADQQQVPYQDQVRMAVKIRDAGFKGMKIRAWRPNPMDDVEVCRLIKEATGPDFHLMFDRTAQAPVTASGQQVWDYDTGLKVARGLQTAGAYWLEEPFHRDDYETPARLAAAVDLLITGGEGYSSLENYKQCLLHKTYDILQPDGRNCGGIFRARQVSIMAESFHVPVILHGTISLPLAGWLQATLAIGAPWQEMALLTPPLLPDEQTSPALKVLKTKQMFRIEQGDILAPPYPGIGLDVDDEAVTRYTVRE